KEVFGADSLVIVTQKYHLYRALYIAESLGMEAVGVPADLRGYAGQFMRDIREVVARAKDVLSVWIGAEPTYLGDAIDLSGDGTVTQE
ncbi:MAG: SanA protein, partial [Clostridia bacterium]|nr:SanA protein [Clostridia bacterium]